MYDDLKGKTVVVTGSSKGLGAAMARRFGAETLSQVDPADFSPTGCQGLPTTARHTFSQKTRACRRCVMRLRAGMRGNICAS